MRRNFIVTGKVTVKTYPPSWTGLSKRKPVANVPDVKLEAARSLRALFSTGNEMSLVVSGSERRWTRREYREEPGRGSPELELGCVGGSRLSFIDESPASVITGQSVISTDTTAVVGVDWSFRGLRVVANLTGDAV